MKLTEHFSLGELTASATAKAKNIRNNPELHVLGNLQRLAIELEVVRAELGGKPLRIHSGYRSPELNKAVGGAPNSYHMQGLAADFDPPAGMTHNEAQQILAASPVLDYDLILEEGTKRPESEGGSRWIHLQIPKAGVKGRRLVRDAEVDKLGGKIVRTEPG